MSEWASRTHSAGKRAPGKDSTGPPGMRPSSVGSTIWKLPVRAIDIAWATYAPGSLSVTP